MEACASAAAAPEWTSTRPCGRHAAASDVGLRSGARASPGAVTRLGSGHVRRVRRDLLAPTTRWPGWWWGSDPTRRSPTGGPPCTVKAASLNHHDLWSLRGVGLREDALPMILGCDAAGVDEDGNEVLVHAVISDPSWRGDETEDPRRSLLSERYQGTFADRVAVPRANVVPKPASLSFEEAACLPTAWLTAYRMLFVQGGLQPGADGARPGRRRRRRHGADHAGPGGRPPGARHQPRRGQAGTGARDRRPRRRSRPARGCRTGSTR